MDSGNLIPMLSEIGFGLYSLFQNALMHERVVSKSSRHMRTNRGDHDHRNQNRNTILPKPRDEAEQKDFAEDKNATVLVAPMTTRIGFNHNQADAGEDRDVEPNQKSFGTDIEYVTAE